MKILVTGGAGFIGYHLCKRLLSGNEVFIVDNLSLGTEENVLDLKAAFYNFDVTNPDFFRSITDLGIEAVFHLAANSDIKNPDPDVDYHNTFLTTYFVLEACRKLDIKQLIFASSSAIYGEQEGNIAEGIGNLHPISHYGAAKLASEAFISSYAHHYGIKSWICRFPNVVGPRPTHGILYDFKRKLKDGKLEVLGDGEQCKPYIYVEDLVDAILFIWENSDDDLNIYNIGAPDKIKVKDIAELIATDITYTGKSWVGDVAQYDYDTTKLKKLGWTNNRTSLEAIRLSL